MTPEEYIQQAAQRMRADGNSVSEQSLPGMHAVVGYQSQFRLLWMASKLHLFTVLVGVPQATLEVFENVTAQATRYAKEAKGSFRGLQSGVAAIPVIVASQVMADARAAAEAPPARRFAVITWPAVVDLKDNATYSYSGRVFAGGIYAPWLRERVRATVSMPQEGAT